MEVELHDPNLGETQRVTSVSLVDALKDYLRETAEVYSDLPFAMWAREVGEPNFRVFRCSVTVVTSYDVEVRGTGQNVDRDGGPA